MGAAAGRIAATATPATGKLSGASGLFLQKNETRHQAGSGNQLQQCCLHIQSHAQKQVRCAVITEVRTLDPQRKLLVEIVNQAQTETGV